MNKTGSSILRVPLFRLNNICRNISITCRGEPIQREQLFEYTNGRFLVNEKFQLSKRHVKFDLDALCRRVSSRPSVSSAITSVEKMEGGFSKALLMTAQNRTEVVAKIPCPTIVLAKYSTASEVAVLEYVKSHTSVPVPKVLAWCCDASDPVGTEYILMEKAKGRPLVEVWGELDQLQKFRVIQNLAYLESQLASQRFPAYGSLYIRHSIQSSRAIPVDEVFCISPAYNASRLPQCDNEDDHAGPWTTLRHLGLSLVNCGLSLIEHSPLAPRVPHSGSKEEHTEILKATSNLIPILAENPSLQQYSQPTLWHTDLHLGNIFVSDKDPTETVDIIDWQFVSIMPTFTHVQWPSFIPSPEDYKIGMVAPELPNNFGEIDADEKSFAISERDKALLSKRYEAALAKRHLVSYLALARVDPFMRCLFRLAENTYENGIVPLQDALIQISRNWGRIGFEGPCPYAVSDDEALRHMVEPARYEDWHKLQFYTQELLQSDEDSWVFLELDFDKVKARHDELFQVYMARATEEVSEEARRLWFTLKKRGNI